jgi:L-malate glycosyltransferase
MTSVDQFIPVLDPGDAASNHTLQVQLLLHDLGVASDIYTEQTHPTLADRTRPYESHGGGPVLYQFAIGSKMADALLGGTGPLALNHHNVTPPEFFERWDPPLVHGTNWGLHQLDQLSARVDLAIAVSEYNAQALRRNGFRSPRVAPILLDPTLFVRSVDDDRVRALQAGSADRAWLFVGRLVPNKAQHRLIAALAAYRRVFDPTAVLWLVGGASSPRYERALRDYVTALGLDDAVEFTGAVGPDELGARYRAAAVFVCASEHEGFCVPVLEAMHSELAVVAVDAAAVAETVGTGGLVVPEHSPLVLAGAVHAVLGDPLRRRALVANGLQRLEQLSLAHAREQFTDAVRPWLERVA